MFKLSEEDLINVLMNIKFSLSSTEKKAIDEIADRLENGGDLHMAKRILNMIDNNGAGLDDVRHFCVTFIRSKEERDDYESKN